MVEPVAWTDDLWNIFLNDEYCMLDDDMKKDMIPLYTAPRELSDDVVIPRELAENYLKITEIPRYKRILEDALKKASEK